MTTIIPIRVGAGEYGASVRVLAGPALLSDIGAGSDLVTHRRLFGALPSLTVPVLASVAEAIELRGRGGAAFPFSRKLTTTASSKGKPVVVVNISEGEPASFKDAALAVTRPHLILDGAAIAAEALGAKTVHVVVPSEHPTVVRSIQAALKERGVGHHWHLHQAAPRFVAGQSHAVLELIEGRPNLPVTTWTPAAVSGLKGHPTLLSNAETFAQLAYAALRGPDAVRTLGRPDEPGTRLLTLADHAGGPVVVEVEHGTPWSVILTQEEINRPVLIGGYHGSWLRPGTLANRTVSPHELDDLGVSIGAGVVIALRAGDCPLHRTAELVRYLADQSAHRCGPCFNGLPALADALHLAYVGDPTRNRTLELIGLVSGRGACAHPDGTARLAASLLSTFGDELTRHAAGTCGYIAEEELAG